MTEKEELDLSLEILQMLRDALPKGEVALHDNFYIPFQNMFKAGRFERDFLKVLAKHVSVARLIQMQAYIEITKSGRFFNECRDLAARYQMAELALVEKKFIETGYKDIEAREQSFRDYERLIDEIALGSISEMDMQMIEELPEFDQFTEENKVRAIAIWNKYHHSK
jgi:hypothetical protein